ncbi:MAG: GntR family transcriptional regulator [Planctomycetia bacterium]|nr:GntR family transcriptional regulator [Planctomycetia bacterium]
MNEQNRSSEKSVPVYRRIVDFLEEGIRCGDFPVGGKLPTDGELTARFKTTRSTVAKAMQELKLRNLIDRRIGSGSRVRPEARLLVSPVALIIAGMRDIRFFEPVCSSIAKHCDASGLQLIREYGVTPYVMNECHAETLVQSCLARGVIGVFYAPCELPDSDGPDLNREITQTLTQAGVTVVLLDRDIVHYPQRSQFDLVGIDNYEAGWLQARHLIERGCRKIVYAARSGQVVTMSGRFAGYRFALEAAGIKYHPSWLLTGDSEDVNYAKIILRLGADGVVCFHDPIAIDLLCSFQDLRIPVPEQIKVIGLDDVNYSRYLNIPLTTLRQPCEKIGAAAVERMIRRLAGEEGQAKQILFSAALIPRTSTYQPAYTS